MWERTWLNGWLSPKAANSASGHFPGMDVENSRHKKSGHFDNYLIDRNEKINGLHARYDAQFNVKKLGTIRYQSSFEMLVTYLADRNRTCGACMRSFTAWDIWIVFAWTRM